MISDRIIVSIPKPIAKKSQNKKQDAKTKRGWKTMHVLIGIITAIAGLLWALNSLQNSGFDLNALNPFTWARRRKWAKMYGTKPIHNLAHPIEAAAILIVGMLKEEGEISREQKSAVLQVFEKEFQLTKEKAAEFFASSVYLLKDEINFEQSIKSVLEPNKNKFTDEQATSLVSILERLSSLEGDATATQRHIVDTVRAELKPTEAYTSTWS